MPKRSVLFGGPSITVELFAAIIRLLPKGSTILEIGSGKVSPLWVDVGYRVISIEHDEEWCNRYRGVEYRHVPIHGRWYHRKLFRDAVRSVEDYDLLIIDGPPGTHRVKTNRRGIMDMLGEFDRTKPVAIDDIERKAEAEITEAVIDWMQPADSIPFCRGKRHHSIILLPENWTEKGQR